MGKKSLEHRTLASLQDALKIANSQLETFKNQKDALLKDVNECEALLAQNRREIKDLKHQIEADKDLRDKVVRKKFPKKINKINLIFFNLFSIY